jgi:signal transduction histidine kinase
MTRQTSARLAWSLFGLSVLLSAVGIWLAVVQGFDLGYVITVTLFATIPFGLIGALIASRFPGNAIGWIFFGVGLLQALNVSAGQYARYALTTAPDPMPLGGFAAWLAFWTWMPSLGLLLTFLLLLFPHGRLPSPRWRWAAWLAGAGLVLVLLGMGAGATTVDPRSLITEEPVSFPRAALVTAVGGALMVFIAAIASVTSLIVRFRRSRGEEREQLKWVAYAAVLAFVFIAMQFLPVTFPSLLEPLVGLAILAVPLASGIAILKYRLYDIDVVINKTVLYGVLAAFVTLVYVGIVVGIGALVGSQGNLFLSIMATAIIALAFQPVRRRASHFANRIVYGKRATPYEVLSQFSQGMGASFSAEAALPRMAEIIGEGTGAGRAEVWLRVGGELRPAAIWPHDAENRREPIPVSGDQPPHIPGVARSFPVEHQGELLGALAISMARGETVTPANEKVLGDVASQAGLVLRNVRLIEELRASRQRIVAAQDEERRRLERDIHDGAQQQLVALAVKLRLVEMLARKDPAQAESTAGQAKADAQEALENLRDLARGIYPPLLADQGLAVALEAQARNSTVPARVEPDGIGRYPAEVEAGVYFCVLEALQNVAKYAAATRAMIRIWSEDEDVMFAVQDDGRGFDPETTPRGSGLQNMADRLEALGGSISIDSAPGRGTTVTGRVPVAGERA